MTIVINNNNESLRREMGDSEWEIIQAEQSGADSSEECVSVSSGVSAAPRMSPTSTIDIDHAEKLAELYWGRRHPVSKAARKRKGRKLAKARQAAAKRAAEASKTIEEKHKAQSTPEDDLNSTMELSSDDVVEEWSQSHSVESPCAKMEEASSEADDTGAKEEQTSAPSVASVSSQPPAPIVHEKGAMLYYRRRSETVQPPVLVTVVGVHYDDFPNIYYTIVSRPRREQKFLHGEHAEYPLFEERQTDNKYLYPLDHVFEDCHPLEPSPVPQQEQEQQQQTQDRESEDTAIDERSESCNEESDEKESVEAQQQAPSQQTQQQQQQQQQQQHAVPGFGRPRPATQALPVQVRELDGHYIIQARAPGVHSADLSVTVEEDNTLMINAFSQTLGVHLQQSVKFPRTGVDLRRSAVRLAGGILSIEVPKVVYRRRAAPMYRSPFFF